MNFLNGGALVVEAAEFGVEAGLAKEGVKKLVCSQDGDSGTVLEGLSKDAIAIIIVEN
jgi:hypothetical protein